MKKNLFLLFSFYFFVIQSLIIWALRWDKNFLWLSIINCVFILFIALISKDSKNTEQKDEIIKETIDTQESTDFGNIHIHEEKIQYKIEKPKKTKKINHIWLFIISLLAAIFVWVYFVDIAIHIKYLLSVLSGFVVFIVLGLLFKVSVFKKWESKLYMIVLIGIFVWFIVKSFWLNLLNNKTVEVEWDMLATDSKIIETSLDSGFVAVDDDLENDIDENFVDRKATFQDAIIALITPELLVTGLKNITFNWVSKDDPYYFYYKTAYQKKMIWSSISPQKNLLCETYIVMKWLANDWDVWSYTDIKKAYWNYAEQNNLLDGCEYWEYLMMSHIS